MTSGFGMEVILLLFFFLGIQKDAIGGAGGAKQSQYSDCDSAEGTWGSLPNAGVVVVAVLVIVIPNTKQHNRTGQPKACKYPTSHFHGLNCCLIVVL